MIRTLWRNFDCNCNQYCKTTPGKAKLQLNNMLEVAKAIYEKVNVNPVVLTPVIGDNISTTIIAYAATSLQALRKVFEQMGMTEEFQSFVSRAAEVDELHSGWMTVPADQ